MKFGWLKRIGQKIISSSATAKVAIPIIKAFTPDKVDRLLGKVEDFLAQAARVTVQAEVMGQSMNAAGKDKLKAGAPAFAQLVLKSDVMVGRHIDPEKEAQASAALEGMLSNYADFLNTLEDDDEVAPALPPVPPSN